MKEYTVKTANGGEYTAKLSDEDAKRLNATPVEKAAAPTTKKRTPANKSRTAKNKG